MVYECQENHEKAIESLSEAIKLKPDFAYAFCARGCAKNNIGDFKGALSDTNKAIQLDPKESWYFDCRGYAKAGLSDHKGAIDDFTRSIDLYPDRGWTYVQRLKSRIAIGDLSGITDFAKAFELSQKEGKTQVNTTITKQVAKSADRIKGAIDSLFSNTK